MQVRSRKARRKRLEQKQMTRIVCISDTHGRHPRLKLPDGDILIHAGDFTERGEAYEVDPFLDWFEALPHPHKVFIAGNHDFYLEQHPEYFAEQVRAIPRVHYLNDSGVTLGVVMLTKVFNCVSWVFKNRKLSAGQIYLR